MWGDVLVPWTLGLTTAAVLMMFFKPLEITRLFPRLALMLKLLAVLALLAPLSREFGWYGQLGGPVLQVLFISGLLVTAWISWHRWRQNLTGAVFFLVAHAVLIGSVLIGRLMLLGLLPVNSLTYLSWAPALLAFLLLVHAGIVIDVTVASHQRASVKEEAKAARELVQHEQKLRLEQSVFFSFVAHELRTPLGIIVAGLKNLSRELKNIDEKSLTRIRRLTRAAERMGMLVEQHLTLQRLSSAESLSEILCARHNIPPKEFSCLANPRQPQRAAKRPCRNSGPVNK